MLTITIPGNEDYDESTQRFVKSTPDVTYHLEHSLVSLSRWESKWEKPFLTDEKKSDDEIWDYIQCMEVDGQEIDRSRVTQAMVAQINTYIAAKRTATTFAEVPGAPQAPSREIVTSELVYYWMVALNIPFECQHWHINRLLTLVKVCNRKNQPNKKSGPMTADAKAQRRALNAQRRAQMGTTG